MKDLTKEEAIQKIKDIESENAELTLLHQIASQSGEILSGEVEALKQSNKEMLAALKLVLKTGSGPEETFVKIKNAINNAPE